MIQIFEITEPTDTPTPIFESKVSALGVSVVKGAGVTLSLYEGVDRERPKIVFYDMDEAENYNLADPNAGQTIENEDVMFMLWDGLAYTLETDAGPLQEIWVQVVYDDLEDDPDVNPFVQQGDNGEEQSGENPDDAGTMYNDEPAPENPYN